MKNSYKSFVTLAVLITFIATTSLYPPTAKAATIAETAPKFANCLAAIFTKLKSLVGVEVPVDATDEVARKTCIDAINRALDLFKEIALHRLKHQILSTITDQTINWINGGGKPQFITDPVAFLEEAANKAAGEVIQEIGLGRVCQPFRPKLELVLQQPPRFSRQVSCTLDKVVDNIEEFYNDFKNGGWIGYHEITKPENNYYGALSLALDEIAEREARAIAGAEQEAITGGGFTSTKICEEWTLYGTDPEDGFVTKVIYGPRGVNDEFDFPGPEAPPISPGLTAGYVSPYWSCTKSSITIPGSVKPGLTINALNAQTDNIKTSTELSGYLSAIIDAGINRLIIAGVKGLKKVPKTKTLGIEKETDLPGDLRKTGDEYSGARTEQRVGSSRAALLDNLENASTTLEKAKGDIKSAIALLDQLLTVNRQFNDWCKVNGTAHPITCANYTDSALAALEARASSTLAALKADLAEANSLQTLLASKIKDAGNITSLSELASDDENLRQLLEEITALAAKASNNLASLEEEVAATQSSLNACKEGDECP